MLSTEKTEDTQQLEEAAEESAEPKKPKKEEKAAAAAQSAELLEAAGKETGAAAAKSPAAGQSDEMIAAQQGQSGDKEAAEKAAAKEEASPAKGTVAAAKKAIVKAFKGRFFDAQGGAKAEFTDNFDAAGTKTWKEVGKDVAADAAAFGQGETYQDGDKTTYTGYIYGLYTEVTVLADGAVEKVYFEID